MELNRNKLEISLHTSKMYVQILHLTHFISQNVEWVCLGSWKLSIRSTIWRSRKKFISRERENRSNDSLNRSHKRGVVVCTAAKVKFPRQKNSRAIKHDKLII